MLIIARMVSVGSKYVTKAANFFLITVGLSIVSILLGTIFFAFGIYDGSLSDDERAFNDNLYSNYRPDPKTGVTPTFWGLVAIFYPATTGIVSMKRSLVFLLCTHHKPCTLIICCLFFPP